MIFRKLAAGVAEHFERLRQKPKGAFLWLITIERAIVSIAVMGPVWLIFSPAPRTDLDALPTFPLLAGICVLAPFFETLLSQVLPVAIARWRRWPFWAQVFFSIPFFALPHLPSGWGTVLAAGVIGGFYLGFTYARWREESFRSAFWMTAGMHAAHNTVIVVLMLLGRASGAG